MPGATKQSESRQINFESRPNNYLKIHALDDFTQTEFIKYYVWVPDTLPLRDKIEILAGQVSQLIFRNSPIRLLEISKQGNTQIAIINLSEPAGNDRKPWAQGYFQGSAGGGMTTFALRETFLQRDFQGEWVDGVEFYYEGKPIYGWDHLLLNGRFFRDKNSDP